MNRESGIWKIRLDSGFLILKFLLTLTLALTTISHAEEITTSHGLSIFGDLKYPPGFRHFDYVNPNAPKYGKVTIASIGTYDNLNPYIMKGQSVDGLEMIFDTLMQSSADENFSEYGLIAESVELPKNREWVIFNLRPEAKWQDGSAITADDVVFSFDTIKQKGHPQYKTLYKDVAKAEKLSDHRVKFTFSDAANRELPLIVGQLPIISKIYYQTHDFEKTTLEQPMGSGPYKVESTEPGRSITYKRNKDYWGKNLPVNVGKYNFDTIKIDYYRDDTVAIEALKAGEYDYRRENIAKNWATAYNLPQVKDGRMVKEALPDGTPTGMQCFALNTRRTNFSDRKVREALNYAYDFEWANKQLFYGAYTRNTSYFGNSDFAWQGLPSAAELKLLEPFRDSLPPEVFTTEPFQPTTDGDKNSRTNLLKAQELLEEAGYHLRDMKRINPETNQPMQIEFLLSSASFERVIAPYIRNLKKLGIESTIRTVDSSQYIRRLEDYDFDITLHWFVEGPSPGNEQVNYWHSSRSDIKGGQNIIGIRDKAVDKMVDKIISASSKEELVTATRALDRILLWNYYAIPNWYSRNHRLIYWNKFGRPETTPPFALGFLDTWWVDKEKEAELLKKRSGQY